MGLWTFTQGVISATAGNIGMAFGRWYPALALPPASSRALQGKRVLVSGTNSGIGYETALLLAAHGASVVLLCRSAPKAESARAAIKEATKRADESEADVEYELVDFSSLESVRTFAENWKKKGHEQGRVDILVNNAGTPTNKKQTTAEGFELCYVTNHLSHLLLTLLLLPCFPLDGSGRIINVSSQLMYWTELLDPGPGKGNSKDLLRNVQEGASLGSLTTLRLYARSKAMQMVATLELQRRANGRVVVNAIHPGLVRTNIWSHSTPLRALIRSPLTTYVAFAGILPSQSTVSIMTLATSEDPAVREGGRFWDRMGQRWLPSWMLDVKRREALWSGWVEDASAQAADVRP